MVATKVGTDLNLQGSSTVTGLRTAVAASEAVPLGQVQALINGIGLSANGTVRVVATANVSTASPPSSIDSVTLAVNDAVLLTGQTDATQNGPYVYTGSQLTRRGDTITEAIGWIVREGTANADSLWQVDTTGAITVGTTALAIGKGPTGLSGAGGTTKKLTSTFGDGSATSYTIPNSLGTADLTPSVYDLSGSQPALMLAAVTVTSTSVVVAFNSAPATNTVRLVAVG